MAVLKIIDISEEDTKLPDEAYFKREIRSHFRTSVENYGHKKTKKPKTKKREKSTVKKFANYDIFVETGIDAEMFFEIFDKIKPKLRKGYKLEKGERSHKLSNINRLLLVLKWLRHYPRYSQLGKEFNIDPSTVSREIRFILPILVANLNFVQIPTVSKLPKSNLFNNSGAIDGTVHKRNRQHPKAYFRYDKQAFFVGSQVWTGPLGNLFHFVFSKGHNNDQGVFNRSVLKNFININNITLLADGGYSNISLMTPKKAEKLKKSNAQKQERSLVEIVIGYIKNWRAAEDKFQQSTEIQIMALWVIYQLAAKKLQKYPIRFKKEE